MSAKPTHIRWHERLVSRADYHRRNRHPSMVLWFTGLSGSGKSTISHAVERQLFDRGWYTYLLDGDNVRHGLNRDLGFSAADRKENIRRVGEVAKLFVDAGLLVLTAFISPFRDDRERVRALFRPGEFVEIHVKCDLATCERRDPKGLYRKARAGEIPDFTGISSPYEEPDSPDLVLDTARWSVDECVSHVVRYVETRKQDWFQPLTERREAR